MTSGFIFRLGQVFGAVSGLYDKYLMASPENGGVGLDRMVVQSYYNLPGGYDGRHDALLWWPRSRPRLSGGIGASFRFRSSCRRQASFRFGTQPDGAMISIVSMVRRGSVIVSFLWSHGFPREELAEQGRGLVLVLLGMFLYLGSR